VQWDPLWLLDDRLVLFAAQGIVPRCRFVREPPARKVAGARGLDEGRHPAPPGQVFFFFFSIAHVAVLFGGLVALSDSNFLTVGDEEIVGLIGPHCAGKTNRLQRSRVLKPHAARFAICNTLLTPQKPHEIAALGSRAAFPSTSARVFLREQYRFGKRADIGLHRRGARGSGTALRCRRSTPRKESLPTRRARNPSSVGGARARAGRRLPPPSFRWRAAPCSACGFGACRAALHAASGLAGVAACIRASAKVRNWWRAFALGCPRAFWWSTTCPMVMQCPDRNRRPQLRGARIIDEGSSGR